MASTVQVPSVWPVGSNVSITGQVTSGDGHVAGALAGSLFGVPTVKSMFRALPVGVASAQSFGSPTIKSGAAKPALGGVPSAQQFGVLHIAVMQFVAVGGVGSSQSFGAPKLASATRLPGGVPSAQQFGVLTPKATVKVPVNGVPPGYPVWVPSITGQVVSGDGHLVGGYGGPCGFVTILTRVTVAVGAVFTAQQFGTVRANAIVHSAGVDSAQRFGTIKIIAGPVWIPVRGIASAQAFGKPDVFRVYLRPEICTDLDLALLACTDLVLTVSACTDLTLVPATIE